MNEQAIPENVMAKKAAQALELFTAHSSVVLGPSADIPVATVTRPIDFSFLYCDAEYRVRFAPYPVELWFFELPGYGTVYFFRAGIVDIYCVDSGVEYVPRVLYSDDVYNILVGCPDASVKEEAEFLLNLGMIDEYGFYPEVAYDYRNRERKPTAFSRGSVNFRVPLLVEMAD